MVHRTRRGSCGPRNACTALTPLALLMALCVTVWSVSNGLRRQPPQPTSPVTGPQPQPVPPTVPPPSPLPPMGFEGPGLGSSMRPPPSLVQQPQRPPITIDPKTPLKGRLLPTPPKVKATDRRGPADNLASVPELDFQTAPAKDSRRARSRRTRPTCSPPSTSSTARRPTGSCKPCATTGPIWTACPSPWATPAGPAASATGNSPSRSAWSVRPCKSQSRRRVPRPASPGKSQSRRRTPGPASPEANTTAPPPSGSSSRRFVNSRIKARRRSTGAGGKTSPWPVSRP